MDDIYLNNFNTELSEEEELEFQNWLVDAIKKYNVDLSKDLFTYDLRGYWKNTENNEKEKFMRREVHAPDTYKKPNHPTFSIESIYNSPTYQGGEWKYTKDGKEYFVPSKQQLQLKKEYEKYNK